MCRACTLITEEQPWTPPLVAGHLRPELSLANQGERGSADVTPPAEDRDGLGPKRRRCCCPCPLGGGGPAAAAQP